MIAFNICRATILNFLIRKKTWNIWKGVWKVMMIKTPYINVLVLKRIVALFKTVLVKWTLAFLDQLYISLHLVIRLIYVNKTLKRASIMSTLHNNSIYLIGVIHASSVQRKCVPFPIYLEPLKYYGWYHVRIFCWYIYSTLSHLFPHLQALLIMLRRYCKLKKFICSQFH